MDVQHVPSLVEDLRRKVLRLNVEMREVRRQLGALLASQETSTVCVSDEEIDPELLSLVGVDPPLPRGAERKELRGVVAARHSTP